MESNKIEHAFMQEIIPTNPLPLAAKLFDLVSERGTESIRNDPAVKSCLWVLMAQAYGQLATIHMSEEYHEIREAILKD